VQELSTFETASALGLTEENVKVRLHPMHIYHMNHEDARAIVAYLKSLPEKVH
jgi:hypothetical protein